LPEREMPDPDPADNPLQELVNEFADFLGKVKEPPPPPPHKIFPRNLTARAAYVVRGNPASSRPESGVDNCFPGLEFDQRNLDQRFFPGLIFYYHRADGVRLIESDPTPAQRAAGLKPEYLTTDSPLYLWGLIGRHLVQVSEPSMVSFQGQSGIEAWRRVHDLLPGTVGIVLGPSPPLPGKLTKALRDQLTAAYEEAKAAPAPCKVVHNPDGTLVLVDQRARYLDEDGVIDPAAYAPGDITKTMCAPWMYDFRDCYCFYWSSNKPDIVDVPYDEHGQKRVRATVNFIRRVEDRGKKPPPQDVDYYMKAQDGKPVLVNGKPVLRRALELDYPDLVNGWWRKLPVVLDDRENVEGVSSPRPKHTGLADSMTRDDMVRELAYLATVEHALAVEYLYAYYSLAIPPHTPSAARYGRRAPEVPADAKDETQNRIAAAANQLFQIAVEEMRHFMWANLALNFLQAPSCVARAEIIGQTPDPATNQRRVIDPKASYLNRPFALKPLTRETLEWFVDVEAPSKTVNEGLDGMYVYVLEHLISRKKDYVGYLVDLVAPMIKVIIDEGHAHWIRFTRIKETLTGIEEKDYLQELSNDQPDELQAQYLDLCDTYYQSLLHTIEVGISLGPEGVGWGKQAQLVEGAVRMMRSLHEAALEVSAKGFLPRFALAAAKAAAQPASQLAAAANLASAAAGAAAAPHGEAVARLDATYDKLDATLKSMSMSGDPAAQKLAAAHRPRLAEHISSVDSALMRKPATNSTP
jgi:hypothetical protein